MYVCICKAVTDSQIVSAIDNGLCTRKKLTHCFGLGKDCGKCNKDVIALLEQTIMSAQAFSPTLTQPDEKLVNSLIEDLPIHPCPQSFNMVRANP